MFEINNLKNIKKNNLCLEIINFYKDPDSICNLLNNKKPYIHKWGEKNSLNTIDFLDCRHYFISKNFKKTEKKIYKFLKQNEKNAKGEVITNFTKFSNVKDNFKKNYWWPHTDDSLYNCIIYLNKEPCDGTNIYVQLKDNENNEDTEHSNPWQNKKNYKIIQNIKPEYNKLVIFRACLHHGLAYNENKFNDRFRKNQVIFV